jgi:hypothetical protein
VKDLSVSELFDLVKCLSNKTRENNCDHPYDVGSAYLIRTMTHYYTGRLRSVYQSELLLDDAAWIADTGRYADALVSGKLNEVEPIVGPVVIGRGAIVDAVKWPNNIPLPRDQK